MHDDELTPAEKEALESLSRERMPSDLLQDRVVRELHGRRLLGAAAGERTLPARWRLAGAVAASIVLLATGFVLGRYHGKLTCRACHKRLLFLRKLEGDCGACHQDWDAETFDHAVTGQRLDENHVEFDCEECHVDSRFDRPPACNECHDEEEGISFPNRRPGPVVTAEAPAAS